MEVTNIPTNPPRTPNLHNRCWHPRRATHRHWRAFCRGRRPEVALLLCSTGSPSLHQFRYVCFGVPPLSSLCFLLSSSQNVLGGRPGWGCGAGRTPNQSILCLGALCLSMPSVDNERRLFLDDLRGSLHKTKSKTQSKAH